MYVVVQTEVTRQHYNTGDDDQPSSCPQVETVKRFCNAVSSHGSNFTSVLRRFLAVILARRVEHQNYPPLRCQTRVWDVWAISKQCHSNRLKPTVRACPWQALADGIDEQRLEDSQRYSHDRLTSITDLGASRVRVLIETFNLPVHRPDIRKELLYVQFTPPKALWYRCLAAATERRKHFKLFIIKNFDVV